MVKYVAPQHGSKSFTCPHCGVLARQYFFSNNAELALSNTFAGNDSVATNICENCDGFCVWVKGRLVHPDVVSTPLASEDMPESIRRTYEEAASIASRSPRGSAALLRLALQNLLTELSAKPGINEAIAELVKQGMPVRIQQALDIVRVVGNNAVHPGQIDVDDEATVTVMFDLLNMICEYAITMPKKLTQLYGDLPEGYRAAIDRRDRR